MSSSLRVPDRKLLILDLDETLIFATERPLARRPDFLVGPYHVYKRPHLDPFLEFCRGAFRLAVWTTASAEFARAVVDALLPDDVRLEFEWSRGRCTRRYDPETGGWYWVKDLRKVRKLGFPLEQVIVVDDTARKHERNYGNLVGVRPFEGEQDDRELVLLVHFLGTLKEVDNVRTVEKRGWQRATLARLG